MSFGGAPPGGGFGPPGGLASGLPFSGVPSELKERADQILAREPEHRADAIAFSQSIYDRRPFSLRRFLLEHRLAFGGVMALVVIETVASQAGGLLTRAAIDRGVLPKRWSVVVTVAILYAFAVGISTLAGAARAAWAGRVGQRLLYDLRVRVFSHLQRLSLDYFTEERAGRIMTRMTSDIEALSQLLQDGIVNLMVQALTLVVVTLILFSLQPALALLTVVVIVPTLTVVSLWFRRSSDRTYGAVRDRIADVMADLSENLSGIRTITAYNRARHNVIAHRNIVRRYRDANVRTATINATYGPSADLIGNVGQIVVLAVGARMVRSGSLTVGSLAAFVLYLSAFFAPIQQIVQLYTVYQSGRAATLKLREVLSDEPSVPEAADACDLPAIEGRIELRGVTFGYDPARPVLHDINLVIHAGETVALVGATGSGKSTIAKLITRFYDPSSGSVLIDGCDVRTVTLSSLRRQLGIVPQEPFLFAGTIRDNVSYGRPDSTDADLARVCDMVGLTDLVERSPDGLDQVVHERGVSFSSGERQLLALARALQNEPRVIVLDEATSNLDLASEAMVERALDAVLDGRTAVIIAHRLATAMRADRIVVMDSGRIVEDGPHAELVAAGGRYAALYAAFMEHA
jgi:ATP-binding cassette, subfamily B, bacterial